MAQLQSDEVRAHWEAIAPQLAPLFAQIDRVEDWPVDDVPAIAEKIVTLGLALQDPSTPAVLESTDNAQLLFILVYMRTSKALRLIQWLDEAHDGLGTRLLTALLASDGAAVFAGVSHDTLAKAMVARLRVVQNTPFFASIFHPARLAKIRRAISTHSESSSHA